MTKKKVVTLIKWLGISVGTLMLLITVLVFIFKNRIIQYVVTEINHHLTAKVQVQKIDVTFWRTFPRVGVDFEKVLILDTVNHINDTVIYSNLIRLKFNAKDLWNKKYVLEGAEIFPGLAKLKVDEKGRENYLIYKSSDTTSTTPIDFRLENIKLYDFHLQYENRLTHQAVNLHTKKVQFEGDFKEDLFELAIASELKINSIKNQNIVLISNKNAKIDVKLLIDKKKDLVTLPSSEIIIENLPFLVQGLVSPDKLQFEIDGKQLQIQDVVNNFLSGYNEVTKYQGSGLATFHLSILDDMQKSTPVWIEAQFKVKNGMLIEPTQNLKLTDVQVEGEYSNKKGVGKEFVRLKTFSFQSPTGPFNGKFMMSNFNQPNYRGEAHGTLNLPVLIHLFKINEIDSVQGNLVTNVRFDVSKSKDGYAINDFHGDVNLIDIALRWKGLKHRLENINGEIVFDKANAFFQNLSLKVNQSDLKMTGELNKIDAYLRRTENLIANVEIQSNYVDVADLAFQSNSVISGEPSRIANEKQYKLPFDIQGNISVIVKKMKYRDHIFSQLQSSIQVVNRKWVFNHLNVENGGSSVQGIVQLEEIRPHYFMVETELQSKGIDFKKLFQEWNNFGQQVILDKNVSGYAVVNLKLKAPFDWDKGMDKKQLVSTVGIHIVDGSLKNIPVFKTIMESLKKSATKLVISKRQLDLFEKRLSDLKFEQLQNDFTIQNEKITIPEMLIKSSALDVNLNGWHTFDNQIDYHFSFRFRDVKTIQRESEFGIVEDDGTGMNVFMRMTGTIEHPKISWDREAQKIQSKENQQKAKEDARSILKTEFGIGKNNPNIKEYQPKAKKQVEIEVDDGSKSNSELKNEGKEESVLKKEIRKKIEAAKKEQESEVEFEIEY